MIFSRIDFGKFSSNILFLYLSIDQSRAKVRYKILENVIIREEKNKDIKVYFKYLLFILIIKNGIVTKIAANNPNKAPLDPLYIIVNKLADIPRVIKENFNNSIFEFFIKSLFVLKFLL